jgi:pimeloyl-ACP methyl ester carboxylesterase
VRLGILLVLSASVAAEAVRFRTADGLEIAAAFHPAGAGAPTVICLPMYRHDRSTYGPLLGPLKAKGISVLALDLRGHGRSAPDLADRVRGRDPKLFNAMYADVEAALAFLEEERGCDATRVGLVGASVGCSVAIDATVRNAHAIRAAVLLTPGSSYLGVPTLRHLQRWPGTRIFTFCSFEEERTSKPVIEALDRHEGSSYMFCDAERIHGTRMFGKVAGIEELIARFLEGSLVRGADLRVPRWAAGAPATEARANSLRPRRRVGGTTYGLMTWIVGDRWSFGASVDRPFRGNVRFKVGDATVGLPLASGQAAGQVEGKTSRGQPVVGSRGSRDGQSWVSLGLDGLESGVDLVIEFLPERGAPVRLPAAGHFDAIPTPHRRD